MQKRQKLNDFRNQALQRTQLIHQGDPLLLLLDMRHRFLSGISKLATESEVRNKENRADTGYFEVHP